MSKPKKLTFREGALYIRGLVLKKGISARANSLKEPDRHQFYSAIAAIYRHPRFKGKGGWHRFVKDVLRVTPLKIINDGQESFSVPVHPTREWARSFIRQRIREEQKRNPVLAAQQPWLQHGWWRQNKALQMTYAFLKRNHFFGHKNFSEYVLNEINSSPNPEPRAQN